MPVLKRARAVCNLARARAFSSHDRPGHNAIETDYVTVSTFVEDFV